ncbi:MAG: 50S ribosomal protein L31e [Candidatus Woesearchaeota archaeon]
MALERTYVIPLRKGWLKAPRYRRAKKAVNTIKEFVARHMKSDDVRLMPELNIELWKHGMKNPPPRIKVNAVRDDKGVVKVQLFGIPIVQEVKEEKKGLVKKIAEKVTGRKEKAKPSEPMAEAKAETVKVEAKPENLKAETKAELPKVGTKSETSKSPAEKPLPKPAPKKPAAKKEAA